MIVSEVSVTKSLLIYNTIWDDANLHLLCSALNALAGRLGPWDLPQHCQGHSERGTFSASEDLDEVEQPQKRFAFAEALLPDLS